MERREWHAFVYNYVFMYICLCVDGDESSMFFVYTYVLADLMHVCKPC